MTLNLLTYTPQKNLRKKKKKSEKFHEVIKV